MLLAIVLATLRSADVNPAAVPPFGMSDHRQIGAPRASETPSQGTTAMTGAPFPARTALQEPASRAASMSGLILIAKGYALGRLGAKQYACLAAIVQRESRWNPLARNRKSGAFGLPQGIGLTTTDPTAQLAWMIRYVDRRYGSACRAWTFWQAHRYY